MQILFIILNDLNYLDEILQKFLARKVRGATIIDSEGMATAMMANEGFYNLLAGPFAGALEGGSKRSKTIFTVINDPAKVDEVVGEVREIASKSQENVIGFMFTLPVSGIYPLRSNKQNKN
ncbi:MAG: hypothetical protein GX813_04780 [Erysipelotrichia bacterium]|nr:hypothetical protein [Erysipelotrichia bacterium]